MTKYEREEEIGGQTGMSVAPPNSDIRSYRFGDLDLEIAAGRLPPGDRTILILHLMSHTQDSIASIFGVDRSMISKRLKAIRDSLARQLR